MNAQPPDEIAPLAKRMGQVMRRFRVAHPLSPPVWDSGIHTILTSPDGQPATKALVWYPSPGCGHARTGGCTYCNFGENTGLARMSHKLRDDYVFDRFNQQLARLDPGTRFIHLGPGGSVLAEHELSEPLRHRMYLALSRFPFLESVGIETRAAGLTVAMIEDDIVHLPAGLSEFSVGFGLESSDDWVRSVAINKRLSLPSLLAALHNISEANRRSRGPRVTADIYVFLKPPFVTEQEAIIDAARSVEWAFDNGAATVSVFLGTVKEQTLCAWLAEQTDPPPFRYEPPFYYSAFEVLRLLAPPLAARTLFLGLVSGVPFRKGPRCCSLCGPYLSGLLTAHNVTRERALLDVARQVRCACRDNWQASLDLRPPLSLPQRLRAYVERLELVNFETNDG
jgi:hypothetical protein